MQDQPSCFTCHTRPAGNDLAGPFSAYCATCQPWDGDAPRGAEAWCEYCGTRFTGNSAFDHHLRERKKLPPRLRAAYRRADGAGYVHLAPEDAGLVQVTRNDGRVLWGWPGREDWSSLRRPHESEGLDGPSEGNRMPVKGAAA